ncbi:MAG: NADP-dependent oxidoreductase [Austwickia sp.]|nr:NADP-dependent oxidoreductase [Austwickia sp.]MBK8437760.1 NADP-dependent oxidoreductase [Austwickia sp.]MBK9100068.1 NADP-dependent oxidoreductase [Austwickia sp.]
MPTSRAWHLVRRPVGEPVADDVALVESVLPDPVTGEVAVANEFVSVDPYMRNRMNDARSYVPPFALDAPMTGGAVGRVTEVVGPAVDETGRPIEVGDRVVHDHGWRTHAVLPGGQTRVVAAAGSSGQVPAQAWLGVLGMPGLTAYAGLLRIGEFRPGDVVYVNAAAGAVGSLVGQIARLKGASRVVGSAGGPQKVAWLTEVAGFDAAIDYRAMPLPLGLRRFAPDGIDVCFENVGGTQLPVALSNMREGGRVVLCGMIAAYNATEAVPGPANLALAITRRLTIRGFIVYDHEDLRADFEREVTAWIRTGQVHWQESVSEGIDSAFEAFTAMMRGQSVGKAVVAVSP